MRKFLVGLVAAAALLVAPATSQAYLHLSNAQNYCTSVTYAPADAGFVYSGYGHVAYQLDGGTNTAAYDRIGDTQVRVLCDNVSQYCPVNLGMPACGPPLWTGSQAANFVVGGSDGTEYTVSWYWCYQGVTLSPSPAGTYWGCPTI